MDKKDIYRQWKQGYVAWGEYRDVIRTCRDGIRKVKVQMELHLAMDLKNNKKGFQKYICQKRQTEVCISPDE